MPKKFIMYPVITAKIPSPKAAHIIKSEFSEGVRSNSYSFGIDNRRGNKTEHIIPSTAELNRTPIYPLIYFIIISDREEKAIDPRIK